MEQIPYISNCNATVTWFPTLPQDPATKRLTAKDRVNLPDDKLTGAHSPRMCVPFVRLV